MGQGSFSPNVENEPFCCKAVEKALLSRALVMDSAPLKLRDIWMIILQSVLLGLN